MRERKKKRRKREEYRKIEWVEKWKTTAVFSGDRFVPISTSAVTRQPRHSIPSFFSPYVSLATSLFCSRSIRFPLVVAAIQTVKPIAWDDVKWEKKEEIRPMRNKETRWANRTYGTRIKHTKTNIQTCIKNIPRVTVFLKHEPLGNPSLFISNSICPALITSPTFLVFFYFPTQLAWLTDFKPKRRHI